MGHRNSRQLLPPMGPYPNPRAVTPNPMTSNPHMPMSPPRDISARNPKIRSAIPIPITRAPDVTFSRRRWHRLVLQWRDRGIGWLRNRRTGKQSESGREQKATCRRNQRKPPARFSYPHHAPSKPSISDPG